MAKNLDRAPEYFRGPIARGIAEGAVDRAGGNDKAGIIRGLAVVTRGVAKTHDLWVDSVFLEQTAEAIEKARFGAKARFTHPNLSGDGLGKFLGRVQDARIDGDTVRADLHFSRAAHRTPDGDLATYVMDLAESDPRAFGESISFRRDYAAEQDFIKQHGKRSPDPDNTEHYRHARLQFLRAVDTVDDPAANPNGLFQSGQEIAADADALLSYSLGLTDEVPELVELGIDPDRGAGFVRRFLDEHGLEVVSKSEPDTHKENEMGKPKTEDVMEATDPVVAELNVAKDALVQELTELKTAPAREIDENKVLQRGMEEERHRQTALRELAGDDVSAELLAKAIDEGWTVEEAAPEFLKDVRGKRADPVRVGQDRGEGLNVALTNAILLGGDPAFPGIDEQAKRDAEQFTGMGFQDLGRIIVGRSGKKVPHDADRLFDSAVSSAELPNILGTAMRRGLHKAYSEYPSVYRLIAALREVKDFRTYTDIKLSEFGSMVELGDGGKFKHDTLVESTETYGAKTYGKTFALTRTTWINDDLNAFRDIPAKLGRAAARNIDELGFALLVSASGVGPTMTEDSKPLFSTTHETANYQTGAGTVLADDGLVAARLLMRKIKHQGLNIEVRPKFLLVPPDLEDTADRLIKSRDLLLGYKGSTDAGPTYLPPYNPHQGSLTILVKASLSDATNGATAWYLVADPNEIPSLVLVYLRGNKNPVLERKDPADVLGIGWRVYHDAGVAAIDWRGLVRSKGA